MIQKGFGFHLQILLKDFPLSFHLLTVQEIYDFYNIYSLRKMCSLGFAYLGVINNSKSKDSEEQ